LRRDDACECTYCHARVTKKAIQLNIVPLEKVKIVRRELRRTPAGDSNIYHLHGLVELVQALQPDVAKERVANKALEGRTQGR
jgi:hypothetical protein